MKIHPLGIRRDYSISWDLAGTEAISGSSWSVAPVEAGGLAVADGSEQIAEDGVTTSCLIEGGIAGHLYEVTNVIETDQGRTDSRTITLRIGRQEAIQ